MHALNSVLLQAKVKIFQRASRLLEVNNEKDTETRIAKVVCNVLKKKKTYRGRNYPAFVYSFTDASANVCWRSWEMHRDNLMNR
jgi:hypothetical protein